MYDFKHILVGVDLSPRGKALTPGSQKALDQAIWLARRSGGRLTLVHSIWSDSYVEPISGDVQVVHEGLSDEAEKVLEGTVERVGLRVGRLESIGTDPTRQSDARVVEVEVRLDDGTSAALLTDLEVEVVIAE